jgi:hypothetical protein
VAETWGWESVTGPNRMDWPTYAAARLYLSEHRLGVLIRKAKRAEDEAFDAARKHATGS